MGEEAKRLSDLVPDGIFVGTSLILRRDGRLLYGARPPRPEGARLVVELTGIGGGMEADDASATVGVQREAHEEIGTGVRLIPCVETLVVRGVGRAETLALAGEERPCALVFRRDRTPPHQPWHESGRSEACLIVFLAELQGEPQPSAEHPGLFWLSPAQVVQAARQDVPVRDLLDAGAALLEREAGALPSSALARLTDSQEALALALGDEAVAFYGALA